MKYRKMMWKHFKEEELKNTGSKGSKISVDMEINFRPDRKGLWFSHTFPVVGIYNSDTDKTDIWVRDCGLVCLGVFDADEGIEFEVDGKITNDDLINDKINLMELLTFLYWQHEIAGEKKMGEKGDFDRLKVQDIPHLEIDGYEALTI